MRRFQQDLLERIAGTHAGGVILDVSGVEVMDAEDFDALRRACEMARVMGARAKDSIYGLAAGIWTHDTARGIRIAERIEAGTVYINNYFNATTQSPVGSFKQSGYGRENGFEGMRCFMQTKSVWLATNPHQPEPFAE